MGPMEANTINDSAAAPRRRWKFFGLAAAIVTAGFAFPLYDLLRLALTSSLYSHLVLIPVISFYFAWQDRAQLKGDQSLPARAWVFLPLALGLGILAGYGLGLSSGWKPPREDYLAVMTLAFLMFLAAAAVLTLGRATLRLLLFPGAFLIFLVPFPVVVNGAIETFFQKGSAEASYLLFKLLGMPVFRQDTVFQLPGFSMEVAPECSGIRSSYVLFITSIVAGQMFLRSNWRRVALTLFVIPLALLRNGIRIVTIGYLCVHISPDMIHSFIHRRGGPIFFVLSLVPFTALLLWLRHAERRKTSPDRGGNQTNS